MSILRARDAPQKITHTKILTLHIFLAKINYCFVLCNYAFMCVHSVSKFDFNCVKRFELDVSEATARVRECTCLFLLMRENDEVN